MTTQWLSIVDFARHFNVSDMTVRRRIKTGKLQAILREGKYYIPYGEGLVEENAASPMAPTQNRGIAQEQFSFAIPAPAPQRLDAERLVNLPPAPQVVAKSIAPPLTEGKAPDQGENASLVEFCNAALAKFNKVEEQLKTQFHSSMSALEEKVKHLEAALELSKLRETRSLQEVQDLQLLLQMMEKS